ncbi:MAG: flagellar hook-basal body complex protein FliE [Tissierellia bacterium]|nr:flagellar hook-basal body complex protein FliE [Tissierellia bacterium]
MNIRNITNLNNLNLTNSSRQEVKEKSNFKDIFNEAMDKLNKKQLEADRMVYDFITGKEDDLHKVMIATEEARLSLELAVQVRNKCVEAYKEINNMQL